MRKAAGATSGKMWDGHIQCGEILDDLAKIGGRQVEDNNEIRQEQHRGGSVEEGAEKMRVTEE